ncbi:hypothetical protein SFUMM280S_02562 [Streptomyces fumanus]
MKEPPDHTAVFSAANLLSPAGMTVPSILEQLRVLHARVGVQEDDALLLQVLADLVVDDLGLGPLAATPATRRCFSASGMPSLS